MGKDFKRISTIVADFDDIDEQRKMYVLIRRGFRTYNTSNLTVQRIDSSHSSLEQPVYGWIRAVSFEEYIRALNELPPIEDLVARPDRAVVTHRVYVKPENGSYYLFRVIFGDGVPHWALDGTVLVRKVAKNAE